MLLNYFKLSFRLLTRNVLVSTINVFGLSVGLATFLLLWQFSRYELKSDQNWKDHERIARLGIFWSWTDDGKNWDSELYGVTGPAFAVDLTKDFPELESYTRIIHRTSFTDDLTGLDKDIVISYQRSADNEFKILEDKVVMADANLFDFFEIPLLRGDPSEALKEINSVALSESLAFKYFGDEDPQGKMISINKLPYLVTAVFKDLPHNTHLDFQMVLSNQAKAEYWSTAYTAPCISSYIKANAGIDWSAFKSKLNAPPMIERYYGVIMRLLNSKASSLVQPLDEVAFSQKWRGDQFNPKSKMLLHIFQSVGIMVLLLAFVNYICLSTTRVNNREKEVATRKVSGATFSDFVNQFTIESALIIVISLALSLTLLQLLKYPLNTLLQIPVYKMDSNAVMVMLSSVTVMVIFSAAYPAYLSRTQKVRDLFSKSSKIKTTLGFHAPLTSLQLSIAVVLIIWGFMTYHQVTFLLTSDLGFNKEDVLVIDAPIFKSSQYESDFEVFRNRCRSLKDVHEVTTSKSVMGDDVWGLSARRTGTDNSAALDSNGGVDENFIPLYGLQLLAGRNFTTNDFGNNIIISEGALYRLGFDSARDAVGASIEIAREQNAKEDQWITAMIIGVIRGYRLRPMLRFSGDHDAKFDAGIAFTYKQNMLSLKPERLSLKIASANATNTLQEVERIYSEIFPGNVFHSYFLDSYINRHYQSERVWRNQILFFTCLAISIACLGMLGMISNKVSQKTKEIGIRKVLGAQLYQIAHLLLSSTAKQVAIASAIGIPVAYYLTQEYLNNFSEKISLNWWHYALPVLMLIVIMLLTVASVLFKATQANPIEALRNE